MDNNPYENQDKRVSNSAERALTSLKDKYLLVGKTHIRAWHAFLVVGLVVGLASGIVLVANRSGEVEMGQAAHSSASTKIPLYFAYHIGDKQDPPFDKNNTHQWMDAAIIGAAWRTLHLGPGTFDWALLDKKIADWTGVADPSGTRPSGKKVIIRVIPYGQNPLGKKFPSCPSCNDDTPLWIYDKGVPKITFTGGGVAEGDLVTVPQVWHKKFYPLYEEFLAALGERYNNNQRIAGFSIGFGHLDTWNAQASKKGAAEVFQSPPFSWTLAKWEEHANTVMDTATRYINKPLMFRAPPLFLRGFEISEDNAQTFASAKRIMDRAAARHFSPVFSALDPVLSLPDHPDTFMVPMTRYLAARTLPADVRVGFMDDWPLWDPTPRGPTEGRDTEGFEKELKFVIDLWDSIHRKIPIFLAFQEPEACATNENPVNAKHKKCVEYQNDPAAKEVRAIAEEYLFDELDSAVAPGNYHESMTVDGRMRTYLLHIPPGFDASKNHSLLLGFHGGGGTGEKFAEQTNFLKKADAEGFIAVFPDGVSNNWNDGRDSTDAYKQGIDDVTFVRVLVESLKKKLPIDVKRVYATGASNGGFFSHRLACGMADVFAAVGVDIAAMPTKLLPKCSPSQPISLVAIQGTEDPFIPIGGGDTKHNALGIGDGGLTESAENTRKFWAEKNGCASTPTTIEPRPRYPDGTYFTLYQYNNCRNNTAVHYYIVNGMGHNWPPLGKIQERVLGPTSQNINAVDVIWQFFKAYPKH